MPLSLGLNEYSSLFNGNRLTFRGAELLGTKGTFASELAHSGFVDRFSYSISQFRFNTDGFSENSSKSNVISDVKMKYLFSEGTSIQAAYHSSRDFHGDTDMKYDAAEYSTEMKQSRDYRTFNLSGRHEISS